MTLLDTIVHALLTYEPGETGTHRTVVRHEGSGENWPTTQQVSKALFNTGAFYGRPFVQGSASSAIWKRDGAIVHGVTCSRPYGLLGREINHVYDHEGNCPFCHPDFWTRVHQRIRTPRRIALTHRNL